MKKLSKQKKLITAALASLVGCTTSLLAPLTANALILIDPFNDGQDISPFAPGSTTDYAESNPATGGGVLGNERQVRINAAPTVGANAGVPGVSFGIDRFIMQHGSGFFDLTSVAKFRYDGTVTSSMSGNPDNPGLNFFDATAGGDTLFAVNVFAQNDLKAGSSLAYTLWNGAISSTVTVLLPVGNTGSVNYIFNFSSFTGIDFTQITAVELSVTTVSNNFQPISIQIDAVQVGIPFEFSPAIGLFSLGALFGLSHLRNRRKSSLSPNPEPSKSEADSLVS